MMIGTSTILLFMNMAREISVKVSIVRLRSCCSQLDSPTLIIIEFFKLLLMTDDFRYGYDCVIIGWSTRCNASERWIRQMGVDRLPLGREQPFYHVLVPDGSQRYAAQGRYSLAHLQFYQV